MNMNLNIKNVFLFFIAVFILNICTSSQAETNNLIPRQSKDQPISSLPSFDYYVFSLSWFPSYCENKLIRNSNQECKNSTREFTVHGLWPQQETSFLFFCQKNPSLVPSKLVRSLLDIMSSSTLIQHEWNKHGTCSGLSQANYFKEVRQAFQKVIIPKEFQNISSAITLTPQEVKDKFRAVNPEIPEDGIRIYCVNRKEEELLDNSASLSLKKSKIPYSEKEKKVKNENGISKTLPDTPLIESLKTVSDIKDIADVLVCMTKDLNFRSCQGSEELVCPAKKVVFPPSPLEKGKQKN